MLFRSLQDAIASNLPQSEIDGINADITSYKNSIARRDRQIEAINKKKSEIDLLTSRSADKMEAIRNGADPNSLPPSFSIYYPDYSNIFNY